jgi:ribosome biogenesis protein UTP30
MTAATSSAQASSTTGVNADLVEKAVSALLKHHEQETAKSSAEKGTLPLLGVDRPLQVQIGLDRVPSVHAHKPTRILIPHPLYKVALVESDEAATETHTASDAGVEEPSVCLIVKEESKPWVKEMVTRFQKYMGCVQKVMGLDSLRKKHSRYEQRRELLQKYDVFLADDRILPMLGKALGRDFYKHKKLPIPIKLTRKEALPFAVQKALTATFVTLSQGTCVTIR